MVYTIDMSLNCTEINIILEELDLSGSFIQQIVQPSFDTLALYTYKNSTAKTVLICLGAGACRINETRKKIPKTEKPLRFMEFMKSRIKGCRIQSCKQIGFERIIQMELSHGDEEFLIFIRLWSNASNIIITDKNLTILDVFYRRPKRKEITGEVFEIPQIREQDKVFESRNFEDLAETIKDNEYLSFETLTFNQKVDLWYSEHSQSLSREALLEQAEKIYISKKSKMESALKKLEEKRESFLTCEQWKHQGDLILSYGHLIDGESKFLECTDYENGNTIQIPIDPNKNAQENAKIYYDKYKKATSGITELEYDISKAKREILDLDANYEALLKEPNPITFT